MSQPAPEPESHPELVTHAGQPSSAAEPPATPSLPRKAFFTESQETAADSYQKLSTGAVIGLVLGLLAPSALFTPGLWVLPLAGVVVCALALQRIAAESPALLGRRAAMVGLFVSVAAGVAAPTDFWFHRLLLRREARQFASAFFELLQRNEPHKAYQLTADPNSRQPFDEKLWDFYAADGMRYREISDFVNMPTIRALLALGQQAKIRYYDTERQWSGLDEEFVEDVYAVTYEENHSRKTFFVRLALRRVPVRRAGESFWRVELAQGGVRPVALGGTQKTKSK